jgi:hypothetical protein
MIEALNARQNIWCILFKFMSIFLVLAYRISPRNCNEFDAGFFPFMQVHAAHSSLDPQSLTSWLCSTSTQQRAISRTTARGTIKSHQIHQLHLFWVFNAEMFNALYRQWIKERKGNLESSIASKISKIQFLKTALFIQHYLLPRFYYLFSDSPPNYQSSHDANGVSMVACGCHPIFCC